MSIKKLQLKFLFNQIDPKTEVQISITHKKTLQTETESDREGGVERKEWRGREGEKQKSS